MERCNNAQTMKSNLIRVDGTGAAHPLDKDASRRMRARQGMFRLLPCPSHVVFMRYVGEDGERDDHDGPVVRLSGEITAAGQMCDVIAVVAHAGWTGELMVLDAQDRRSIFIEAGNVIGAHSSAEDERIGEVLFRYGALTRQQMTDVLAQVGPGRRFGEVATASGLVAPEELYRLMRKQSEEIVLGALRVEDGTFFFLDRYDETRLTSRHVQSANHLLMQGVSTMDELRYFRERIPSDLHVPAKTGFDAEIPENLRDVFDACDGKRSIEALGRALGRGEFDTTRAVFELLQLSVLQIHPPRATGPASIVELFNGAMRLVHEAAESAGRSHELRTQLEGFTTSTVLYSVLFGGAGPGEDGTFDTEIVVDNLDRTDTTGGALAQWLYEYAAFALFVVRQAIPGGEEQALASKVGERLARLSGK